MHAAAPAAELSTTRLSARVYYEDTDAAGVVYYANYWRFCERGRTEWLRALGFGQQNILDESGVAFVVRRVEGDYKRPARLDDVLEIVTSVSDIRRASLNFSQNIFRGAELLFSATVCVACLDTQSNRPTPIPSPIRSLLENVTPA